MGLPRLLLAGLALLPAVPAAAAAAPLVARYEVTVAGMPVVQVEALFDIDGPRYLVRTHTLLRGMVGWFGSGEQTTSAEGIWRGEEPVPSRYRVEGMWRGTRRLVVMDYAPGGMPLLRAIEPVEAEREPVPEALRQGSMDGLSALAKLTRTVARTGRCDGAAEVFDGRRRVDYAVRTVSRDILPVEGGFAGPALRCAFESRLIAGFRRDQDPAEARTPQPAIAWIGEPLPGAGPLPVRIELPTRWFGTIRAVLVSATRADAAAGQAVAR